MDISLTIGSLIGIAGVAFAIITYLRNRDKDKGEDTKLITTLEVKMGLYKEELDNLKQTVGALDTKLMQKIDDLGKKMDELILKLMEK